MVNYCCVQGCGRNSKQNKHLNYYGLPKELKRQIVWLKAAGREDLIQKDQDKVYVAHRFCSRHFRPSSIKNKHLCDDAVPTLYLPGSLNDGIELQKHLGIVCNNCNCQIVGFRYKCVTCEDYDLCQKCEMRETHPEHYLLRMPKPVKYKLADNLVQNWRKFFKARHLTPTSDDGRTTLVSDSSDDEPITKYVQNPNAASLSAEVKKTIRDEVTRVLNLPETEKRNPLLLSKKRMGEEIKKTIKRIRMDGTIGYGEPCESDRAVPEVVFADVNEDGLLEVKAEQPYSIEEPPLVHVKISDDLTELMIEMAGSNPS